LEAAFRFLCFRVPRAEVKVNLATVIGVVLDSDGDFLSNLVSIGHLVYKHTPSRFVLSLSIVRVTADATLSTGLSESFFVAAEQCHVVVVYFTGGNVIGEKSPKGTSRGWIQHDCMPVDDLLSKRHKKANGGKSEQ
jgi:hypothetical protein